MAHVRSIVLALLACSAAACGNSTPTGGTSTGSSTGGGASSTGASSACAGCTGTQVCYQGGCCTPICVGRCAGESDGCGSVCPQQSTGGCGSSGGQTTTGGSASGGSSGGCTPDCTDKCKGASDGCGGTCATGSCNGCCDGNDQCQTGDTQAACGVDGNSCDTCSNGPCQAGICCTRTAEPICSQAASSDGCGGTYAATCPATADGGAQVCCGGNSGTCCGASLCCDDTCCPAGDECSTGGACCTPDCTNKCPNADDGCGQPCPEPATGNPGCDLNGLPGCCDQNGVCQPGDTDTVCGSVQQPACLDCTASGTTCNDSRAGWSCCTPGAGCAYSCGDEYVTDDCGNPCPFDCPSTYCCDDNRDCQPGTAQDACGSGGTPNSCNDCGTNSCVNNACGACTDGDTGVAFCNGFCGTESETCEGGQWVVTGPCLDACGSGCCDPGSGNCVDGTSQTACGNSNNTCVNCTNWATGQQAGYGECLSQSCCLASGAFLGNLPAGECCSGQDSCNLSGDCYCQ